MSWLVTVVSELCIKTSNIGSKIIKIKIFMCVKIIESQMLAMCCKVHWNSYNVITSSLSLLDINYVQMTALSGNVLFCNQMCSKKGDLIIFIRHIRGSVWFRCTHYLYRPDLTPLDFCLWGWMKSRVYRRRWTHETNCSLAFWKLLTTLKSAQTNNLRSLCTNCVAHNIYCNCSGSFHILPKICLHIMVGNFLL